MDVVGTDVKGNGCEGGVEKEDVGESVGNSMACIANILVGHVNTSHDVPAAAARVSAAGCCAFIRSAVCCAVGGVGDTQAVLRR